MTDETRSGSSRDVSWMRALARCPVLAVAALSLAAGTATADSVGTSLPPDFPVILDASLGVPVIGFGASFGCRGDGHNRLE